MHGKWISCALLIGMENVIATLENSWAVLYKLKYTQQSLVHIKSLLQMLLIFLFIITNIWKWPNILQMIHA